MASANGRIVKNTGFLYLRQLLLTFINLYTVRVTLDALGVEDYGLFNVIASVVWSMSILTGAMTSATQRFLSFHLGREDFESYNRSFSMFIICYLIIGGIVLLIGEGLSYFFIYKWLTIPPDRMAASMWVYQMTLLSFLFMLITIPYTSSIVANEKMHAFAVFSIVEGALKLIIAFVIMDYAYDRLKLYGILYAFISMIVFLMSVRYCHGNFKYCRYIWKWNTQHFKELFSYTGWNLFGSISGMLTSQGHNIVLNIFFGPIVNAAKAIADRIQHVIVAFSGNVYMAVSPQIIKAYSVEDYSRAIRLVLKSSTLSFALIFVLSFPLICNISGILDLWLGKDSHSPDMVVFSSLILIYCLVLALEPPISRIIQATGKIRNYQLSVGAFTLSFIPVAVVMLKLGASAASTYVTLIVIMGLAQIVRVIVAHRQVGLSYRDYLKTVIAPIGKICVISLPLYWAVPEFIDRSTLAGLAISVIVTAICGLFIAGIFGLDASDRKMISGFIKNRLDKSSNQ